MNLVKKPKTREPIPFEYLNQETDNNNNDNNIDLAGNICLLRFARSFYYNIHAIFENEEEKEVKKVVRMNFPNEIMLIIFETLLRIESNFPKIFLLRRTCKQWNKLIPVVINDAFTHMFSGNWVIEITACDKKYKTYLLKHVRPIYDASSNLICFMNLNSTSSRTCATSSPPSNSQLSQDNQNNSFSSTTTTTTTTTTSISSLSSQTSQSSTLIDFSNHLSFLFEIKYNNLSVVALDHYIDLLGEKEGEKIFYDVSKTFYCIKTLKNEFFELMYWKIVPNIWFDRMMILDGEHGTIKFSFIAFY
ncbi:hypothetical protein Glove_40g66 [Diversispora epigaea]|uniref:F-box domain-containing protein n=1 Tax=Diversispora epigaea TaxID=1348612 RepID=A0A397JII6_9GLOM|nr:hypothetical protein Glove_40g66 [Diversispora epigaea]